MFKDESLCTESLVKYDKKVEHPNRIVGKEDRGAILLLVVAG